MIDPIFNRNFGNIFHHQDGPKQQQQHAHKNTFQWYQYRSYQIPSTSSITYLNQDCRSCGLNNKGVRELLIQHDGKLENVFSEDHLP